MILITHCYRKISLLFHRIHPSKKKNIENLIFQRKEAKGVIYSGENQLSQLLLVL